MVSPPVAVVFGARSSGAAIISERIEAGWRGMAVARSQETLDRLRERCPDVETRAGDAADPAAVQAALDAARDTFGRIDLVVNAVTAAPRDHVFGGGPVAEAPDGRRDSWLDGFVPQAETILRLGARALAAQGGGTLIQLAGGSSRRGMPARGYWAAAQFAVRGLVQALAQEMRPAGVHVALLVVDGTIATERSPTAGRPPEDSASVQEVARAVAYLTGQSPRAWTHELVLTPVGERWVP